MATQTPTQYAPSSASSGALPPGSLSGLPGSSLPSGPLPATASSAAIAAPGTGLVAGAGQDGAREPGAALGAALGVTNDRPQLHLAPAMARLPVDLEVTVPVREFRVRHLLAMAPGEVIETRWANGEDLPLSSGDVQLAWTEFEVVDSRLAVRVTRLA